MRLRFLALVPFASALPACPPAMAQDDARLKAYGRHLSQECTSCHRLDGVDNGIPSIAGLDADAIIRALKFYRDGARTNPVMVSVASSLDEEQVRALAAYWAWLPRPAPKSGK
mgnify:FL=1